MAIKLLALLAIASTCCTTVFAVKPAAPGPSMAPRPGASPFIPRAHRQHAVIEDELGGKVARCQDPRTTCHTLSCSKKTGRLFSKKKPWCTRHAPKSGRQGNLVQRLYKSWTR